MLYEVSFVNLKSHFIFCITQCSGVWNIMIFWTTLFVEGQNKSWNNWILLINLSLMNTMLTWKIVHYRVFIYKYYVHNLHFAVICHVWFYHGYFTSIWYLRNHMILLVPWSNSKEGGWINLFNHLGLMICPIQNKVNQNCIFYKIHCRYIWVILH